MIRALLAILLTAFLSMTRAAIVFEGEIPSTNLPASRKIHIWLPPNYDTEAARRFPVLYVHDGQNAFTTAGPGAAFGWGNWQLDRTAADLIEQRRTAPFIIVAIDCSRERYQEYRGPLPWCKPGSTDEPYQHYARFLIHELKPKIDRDYRTRPGPADTALLGSSMGGVVSLALAWEYPGVFGQLASLSGAFQVENRAALTNVLSIAQPPPKPIRIYLDSGRSDYTGGDDGLADTTAVAAQLRRLGWPAQNLLHYIDPPLTADQLRPHHLSEGKLNEALRSQHNEFYWRLRAHRPLEFLFPPSPIAHGAP